LANAAAEKLQATTYPFVAFLALQPRRTVGASARNSSPPSLTVLSRHQGKSVPSTAPTSARTLVEHLETQVLPRVSSYLEQLRAAQRERERDRELREEQDRAFHDAARRDVERIQGKIAAEKAEQEAKRRAEEARRAEEVRREMEAEIRRQKEIIRMDWRRWTRRFINKQLSDGPKTLRVAIRLPNGERTIQQFSGTDSLTTLYAFIDSCLIPSHFNLSDDPDFPPGGIDVTEGELTLEDQLSKLGGPSEYWGFIIASSYPRTEIPWQKGIQLSALSQLKGGGQVVVEVIGSQMKTPNSSAQASDDQDDDGYNTEEED